MKLERGFLQREQCTVLPPLVLHAREASSKINIKKKSVNDLDFRVWYEQSFIFNMLSRVAMARRRRSRKTPKFTPALLFVVLALGGLGSLFGHKEQTASQPSPPVAQTTSSPVETQSVAGTQLASAPVEPSVVSAPIAEPGRPIGVIPQPDSITRFVKGRKVALRDGPGKQFGILDRYDSGREVTVLETQGDWSRIRDMLTQRDGWVSASLLTEEKPQSAGPKEEAAPQKKTEPPTAAPSIPNSLIVQRIIAESIAMYPSSCACPYNVDRGGRRCGKRSAYNRGGGYAPLCFPGDVSADMIASFRQQASR
ncbi:SH3 domain-containing protein [Rhizobium sp. GCM10022189]|uniref:SH3 domain-containing protein n=1 Tax=Rhizobium sp. GCM10022189 TaxID=3252654 RepID=UPI0036146A27